MGLILDTSILIADERGKFDMTMNCRGATASKSSMALKTSKMGGFTVTEILIAVVLIGVIAFFAALMIRPHYGGGPGLKDTCISNLRNIDGAKGRWRIELHKQLTDTPTGSDIALYGPRPNWKIAFLPE